MADFAPNSRYRHFTQEIWTAGDYEQFVTKIHEKRKEWTDNASPSTMSHGSSSSSSASVFEFEDHPRWAWKQYRPNQDLFSTFEYIFHKFKKGIYVQIVDNHVQVFLPFSNADYQNEYASSLKIDVTKHGSFEKMYEKICKYEDRPYVPNKVCWYPEMWYCNNGLVRYEYPVKENDSGIHMIYDMLQTLCKERTVPDCEFFVNKRDFPILSLHGYEPYTALVPSETPLYSYACDAYLPILSMCTKRDHADIPIPTWEDWSRASNLHDGRTFPKLYKTYTDNDFCLDWTLKKRTAIFRGASTGLGTTVDTNPRFFFAKLCQDHNRYWDGTDEPYLDVGIAKWNTRPRKHHPDTLLDIPNLEDLGIPLSATMTPVEQSRYRYILHLPGHSCAYRLSLELGMGSVLLIYPSDYYLWYMHMLRPYEHYIPLTKGMDRDEIFEVLDWCESHPDECARIAKNARVFYERYLSYNAILDMLRDTCRWMADHFQFTRIRFHDLSPILRDKEMAIIHAMNNNKKDTGVSLASSDVEDIQVGIKDEVGEMGWSIVRQTKRTTIYRDERTRQMIKTSEDGDLRHAHAVSCLLRQSIVEEGLCQQFLCSVAYDAEKQRLFMPYVGDDEGMPLDRYLMDTTLFRMNQFKGIITQIALALQIVQGRLLFVHYDLTPWNVLLYRSSARQVFRYMDHTVHLQGCRYIAKMIDFEYASIVDDQDSTLIHRMKPFFLSEQHDIVTFVYNSFHILLKHQRLEKVDMDWIRDVMFFLCGQRFHSIQDLKRFLSHERKFSRLLLRHERESWNQPASATFLHRMRRNTSGTNLVRRGSMDRLLNAGGATPSFLDAFVARVGYYGISSSSHRCHEIDQRHHLSISRAEWEHIVTATSTTEDGWLLIFDRMYTFKKMFEAKQMSFDDISDADRKCWIEQDARWKAVGQSMSFDWSRLAPSLPKIQVDDDDRIRQGIQRYRWYTHVAENVKEVKFPLHSWVCRAYRLQYLFEHNYITSKVHEPARCWLQSYEKDWIQCVYHDLLHPPKS